MGKTCSHRDIKSSFVDIKGLSNSNYFRKTVKICSAMLIYLSHVALFSSDQPGQPHSHMISSKYSTMWCEMQA